MPKTKECKGRKSNECGEKDGRDLYSDESLVSGLCEDRLCDGH